MRRRLHQLWLVLTGRRRRRAAQRFSMGGRVGSGDRVPVLLARGVCELSPTQAKLVDDSLRAVGTTLREQVELQRETSRPHFLGR